MRNIRRQPREEVSARQILHHEDKEIIAKSEKKNLTKPKPLKNSIVSIMKMGVTANETKLLEAIESEAEETGSTIPPMSTNYICSKYGINHKYLGDAIKGLIEKGLIKRHPAKFKGQKSFSWEIIQH